MNGLFTPIGLVIYPKGTFKVNKKTRFNQTAGTVLFGFQFRAVAQLTSCSIKTK